MKTVGINPFHVLKEKKRREMQMRKREEKRNNTEKNNFLSKLRNILPRTTPNQDIVSFLASYYRGGFYFIFFNFVSLANKYQK